MKLSLTCDRARRRAVALAAVLVLAPLFGPRPAAAQGVAGNIVPNSGFEDSSAGALSAWTVGSLPPPAAVPGGAGVTTPQNVVVRWADSSAGAGKHSLSMESHGAAGGYAVVISPALRVLPGARYDVSLRYIASGLQAENADRTQHASLVLDISFENAQGRVGNARLITEANTAGWARLSKTVTAPAGTQFAHLHLQLTNKYPNNPVALQWDDIAVVPVDPSLPNSGFEAGAQGGPDGWTQTGAGKTAWAQTPAHSGEHSVSVSDAPDGPVSGWSVEVPVRSDRAYTLGGWAKGGDLNANGFVNGGVLQMQFLGGDGQPLGKPLLSPTVSAHTDWTQIATPKAQPPAGAVTARLTAGLQYCRGTAYFDDLLLAIDEMAAQNVAHVKTVPQAAPGVAYAKNLLANGDVEAGAGGSPSGWTYVGKSTPDWTPQQIQQFHDDGRPTFSIGRGQGEWSRDIVYSGKGALLNVSVDPPLATNNQWHGRNPVDGYWLSAPMPCTPGTAYLASAWVRPGQPISAAWYGPLEVQFFNARGGKLPADGNLRAGLSDVPAGVWSFWATPPWVAPAGAATMRLRFGQELRATDGGWGRTYADNLAVWALPERTPMPDYASLQGNPALFHAWWGQATAKVKPPYAPAPADAPEYESLWGRMENAVPGNVYRDPAAPVAARFTLSNLLGEARTVSLRLTRYDWKGNASAPILVPKVTLNGGSDTTVSVSLPPTQNYGAFYLDAEAMQGAATVGHLSGRYAELPPLNRPRTALNTWGVTPLVPIVSQTPDYQAQLAALFKTAGFSLAWTWLRYSPDPASVAQGLADTQKQIDWYGRHGIRCIVRLGPETTRPVDRAAFEAAGRALGTALKGKVAAVGNWGVEQANSASPYRGGGAARITDDEYDTLLAAQYDGIKAAAPDLPVLVGNIATDMEAKTLHRLYGPAAGGKFDGMVMNAYLGLAMVAQNNIAEMDRHGDTHKLVWQEENADQRSPFEGDGRRYGEAEGPKNMVRSWLTLLSRVPGRVRVATMWGFVTTNPQDINMVTPDLQPRPQYAAFAVLTDALADAQFAADKSGGGLTWYEWKRGDGLFSALWADAGEHELTLPAPSGTLSVMDLMGNVTHLTAQNGQVTLKVGTTPVYVAGGGMDRQAAAP